MVTKRSSHLSSSKTLDTQALLSQALELQQQQQLSRAQKLYEKILTYQPHNFDAHHMLGVIHASKKQYAPALSHFQHALTQQQNQDIHANIAWLAYLCNDMPLLLEHTKLLHNIVGDTPNVHRLFTRYYLFQRQHTLALSHAQKAAKKTLEDDPSDTRSLTLLYRAQVANGHYTDTLQSLEQLCKKNAPHNQNLLFFLASLLSQADIHIQDNPAPFFQKATNILSELSTSLNSEDAARAEAALGHLAQLQNKPHSLISSHFQRAFSLQPDNTMHALGLAFSLLAQKQWRDGFSLYDKRRNLPSMQVKLSKYLHVPHINLSSDLISSPLNGKHVAVLAEQGIGDCIHFMRFAPQLKKIGALTVSLHVPPSLKIIAQSLQGIDNVVSDGDTLPHVDALIPVMSLPAVLNINDNTNPHPYPYLSPLTPSHINPHLSLPKNDNFKIGITWQGNNQYSNDNRRSLPFSLIQNLFPHIPATFYALHTDPSATFLQQALHHKNLVDLSPHLHDFNDTAIVMVQLDLVISVDTSVIHAAGALGVPAWLLLSKNHDWRWHNDTQSSWYPSVSILRVSHHWQDFIPLLKTKLSSHIGGNSLPPQNHDTQNHIIQLLQEKKWKEADTLARDIALTSQDPHIDNLIAIIASQQNNLPTTLSFLQKALKKCRSPQSSLSPSVNEHLFAHIAHNLGNTYIALSRRDEAWLVFKDAISSDKINHDLLRTTVENFHNHDELPPLIKNKRRQQPLNFALSQCSLRIFLFQNKRKDAIALLSHIDQNHHIHLSDLPWPHDTLWAEAGRLAHLDSQHKEAHTAFQNALSLHPNQTHHIINTGTSLALSGHIQKAILFFRKQLLDNYHILIAAELATLYLSQNNIQNAQKLTSHALSLEPQHSRFLEIQLIIHNLNPSSQTS